MDHSSRYLLACEGLYSTTTADAKAVFVRLFRKYGLPNRIRSDNGVPFASTGVGGLSKLAIWWIKLGIIPERIEPGKSQQNGRHERMHRTLKRRIGQPGAADLQAPQVVLDEFVQHYNHERPHESLEQKCPCDFYQHSGRSYPKKLPEIEYPTYFQHARVCSRGLFYWRALRIYIGYLLHREIVGLEPVGDGVWDLYFGPIRLGTIDEKQATGDKQDYLTLKVSPMSVK